MLVQLIVTPYRQNPGLASSAGSRCFKHMMTHQVSTVPIPYPVIVEELNGAEDVKLASHEKLDGQFPGQWRHSMLTGPLVDFL